MRAAFTIIYKGDHHLLHNRFIHHMVHNFDYWVVVYGPALPTGSTSWCKDVFKSLSTLDRTISTLLHASDTFSNLILVEPPGKSWPNKDVQVNVAIETLRKIIPDKKAFLWQVDVDEQWTKGQLDQAERELLSHNGKTGCFLCNYYVGKNLIVKGHWGEGCGEPYRRLWRWEGESFKTHEPPILDGKNGPGLLLTPRFNHFAYYFEEDVRFKEQYYGYKNLVKNWQALQSAVIPIEGVHISALLDSATNHWANTNTKIFKTLK